MSLGSEDVVDRIKRQAGALQRQIERGEAQALRRARKLVELAKLSDEALRARVQRRHCLSVLSRELGLNGWSHLTELWSSTTPHGYARLFYPPHCGGHFNIWSSSLDEARAILSEHRGYLLPFRDQFMIVEWPFIEELGLDPQHQDWTRVARNLVEPGDLEARQRLVRALLRARVDAHLSCS